MPTFTQDYPALPGSIDAAVQHARTVVKQCQPDRVDDAEQVVRALFADALTRTPLDGNISFITAVDLSHVRFEIHDANTPVPGALADPGAHRLVSALADRYGSGGTRNGHKAWAELHVRQVAPV
ncbi:hypothetical protein OG884_19005 [Streptosporangium sp. NBC_01755]|uniref:hypothetical protein n=1 Tax=Streptosporangium sp. NBC_01755 TaxID=2975949 RepID=UPI002DDAFD4D|nr:hypothetical protein [Streptosporangium sp. NBC_01755]WSD03899.1 hypothetical protein OG884_19005 [Streptosporangium sp. NBC_01755]